MSSYTVNPFMRQGTREALLEHVCLTNDCQECFLQICQDKTASCSFPSGVLRCFPDSGSLVRRSGPHVSQVSKANEGYFAGCLAPVSICAANWADAWCSGGLCGEFGELCRAVCAAALPVLIAWELAPGRDSGGRGS